MAVPFSNTKLRVPMGFRNLLEGFTREVLRSHPDDIYIFGARYFHYLQSSRTANVDLDPCRIGNNHEDRFYNAKMWKNDDMATMCSKEMNDAAQTIQREFKAMTSAKMVIHLEEESAAKNIQRVYRGYKDRKNQKIGRVQEELAEKPDETYNPINEEEEKKLSEAAVKITAAFQGMAERNSIDATETEVKEPPQEEKGQ